MPTPDAPPLTPADRDADWREWMTDPPTDRDTPVDYRRDGGQIGIIIPRTLPEWWNIVGVEWRARLAEAGNE